MAVTRTIITTVLTLIQLTSSRNISFNIIGGEYAKISDFPHAVALTTATTVCGGSVLNQDIILTAAHCILSALPEWESYLAFVGHENREQGRAYQISASKTHEEYSHSALSKDDIGLLILTKSLELGKNVRRVALMASPPYEMAQVAGWGLTYEQQVFGEDLWLKSTKQRVMRRETCIVQFCCIPPGKFCTRYPTGFIYRGDSGSALVVRGYIQIGFAAYKSTNNRKITIFTNVSYYLPWITKTTRDLYCTRKSVSPTK